MIIDDYSRAVAGYFLGFQTPSALQTALTLRGAIWRKADAHWHVCGIPDRFYTDHGSDFNSQHMAQVSADIKMQLIFSWPGQPRGRGRIERFFNTVNQMFLEVQLPGPDAGRLCGRGRDHPLRPPRYARSPARGTSPPPIAPQPAPEQSGPDQRG